MQNGACGKMSVDSRVQNLDFDLVTTQTHFHEQKNGKKILSIF